MRFKKIIAGALSLATLTASVPMAQTGIFVTAMDDGYSESAESVPQEDESYTGEEVYTTTSEAYSDYTEETYPALATSDYYSYGTEATTATDEEEPTKSSKYLLDEDSVPTDLYFYAIDENFDKLTESLKFSGEKPQNIRYEYNGGVVESPAGVFSQGTHKYELKIYGDGEYVGKATVYIGIKGDANLDDNVDSRDTVSVLVFYGNNLAENQRPLQTVDSTLEGLARYLADVDTETTDSENITSLDAMYILDFYAYSIAHIYKSFDQLINSSERYTSPAVNIKVGDVIVDADASYVTVPVYYTGTETPQFAAGGMKFEVEVSSENGDKPVFSGINGDSIVEAKGFNNSSSGKIGVSFARDMNFKFYEENLFELNFMLPNNIKDGDKFTIKASMDRLYNDSGEPVESTITDGSINIGYNSDINKIPSTELFYGDANGNGEIDEDDYKIILQHYADLIAGKDVASISEDAADVNKDGKITVKDAYYIYIYYNDYRNVGTGSFDKLTEKEGGDADYTVDISVGNVEVSKSEKTVEIPIEIGNKPDGETLLLAMKYTASAGKFEAFDAPGAYSSVSGSTIAVTDLFGNYYYLKYELPEDAKVGDVYDITPYVEELANWKGENVSYNLTAGKVTVVEDIENKVKEQYSYDHSDDKETVVEVAKVKVNKAAIGSTIYIPVSIFNNPGIASSAMLYESSVGSFEHEAKKWLFKPVTAIGTKLIAVTTTTAKNVYGDGALYYLKYNVPEDAKVGDIIDIKADKKMFCDDVGMDVSTKIYGGSITIVGSTDSTEPTTTKPATTTKEPTKSTTTTTTTTNSNKNTSLGDLNGDGKIDSKDAVIVLKAYAENLAGNESDVSVELGDINGDKKLDSKDAVKILRYYASNLAGIYSGNITDFK